MIKTVSEKNEKIETSVDRSRGKFKDGEFERFREFVVERPNLTKLEIYRDREASRYVRKHYKGKIYAAVYDVIENRRKFAEISPEEFIPFISYALNSLEYVGNHNKLQITSEDLKEDVIQDTLLKIIELRDSFEDHRNSYEKAGYLFGIVKCNLQRYVAIGNSPLKISKSYVGPINFMLNFGFSPREAKKVRCKKKLDNIKRSSIETLEKMVKAFTGRVELEEEMIWYDDVQEDDSLDKLMTDVLTDREYDILRKRYWEDLTLEEIKNPKLGISRQAIQQINSKALKRLRRRLEETKTIKRLDFQESLT